MLKLENSEVLGWEAAIRGMRNPMNSWEKSDSAFDCADVYEYCDECSYHSSEGPTICKRDQTGEDFLLIGPNDLDLMKRLRNAGTDHRKFMRMITVYVDITGPLYWWKEFDTYKVGTVANSCSTMHKIAAKEFTLEDFSCEHLDRFVKDTGMDVAPVYDFKQPLEYIVKCLNDARNLYLETKDKKYWWQMIQLLPSSYNQRRTVQMNYEVLANIYKSRRNHKLDEWHTFCDWIEGLPYSELITGMEPISHEVISDSTPLFLRKSMTIPATAEDIEDSLDISHLVDITCSWDVEELGSERIYAIGPGFTREDLTPYELYLLERSEEYERRKKEE